MKFQKLFLIFSITMLFFSITIVSASRLPTIDGDEDSWGTILNDFLSKIAGNDAIQLNETMVNGTNIYSSSINTSHLLDGTITADDLADNSVNSSAIDLTEVTLSDFTNDANYLDKDEGGIIDGSLIINGNLSLVGSYLNTTVTNQYLNGSFLPSIIGLFDIGSSVLIWNNLYLTKIFATDWSNVTITESQVSDSDWWDADGDLTADEISEANINFATSCGVGNHLYIDGNDLSCEVDATGGNSSFNQTLTDDLYAKYQFTNNNFNGSGNINTTGKICDSVGCIGDSEYIPTVLTICSDSACDFTSIQTACDSFADSSQTKPYLLEIYGGTYEDVNCESDNYVTFHCLNAVTINGTANALKVGDGATIDGCTINGVTVGLNAFGEDNVTIRDCDIFGGYDGISGGSTKKLHVTDTKISGNYDAWNLGLATNVFMDGIDISLTPSGSSTGACVYLYGTQGMFYNINCYSRGSVNEIQGIRTGLLPSNVSIYNLNIDLVNSGTYADGIILLDTDDNIKIYGGSILTSANTLAYDVDNSINGNLVLSAVSYNTSKTVGNISGNFQIPQNLEVGENITIGNRICNASDCFTLQELNTTGTSSGNLSFNQTLTDGIYAKYNFTNNNFNGSGNFTTTGIFASHDQAIIGDGTNDALTINQGADSKGIAINGFDDMSGVSLKSYITDTGYSRIFASSHLWFRSGGTLLFTALGDARMDVGDDFTIDLDGGAGSANVFSVRDHNNIILWSIDNAGDMSLTQGDLNLAAGNFTTTGTGTFGSTTDGVVLNDGSTSLHVYGTDTTEYATIDTGINLHFVGTPTQLTATLVAEVGSVDVGKHYYYVTYYTALGETDADVASAGRAEITADAGHSKVDLTDIPVSSDYRVIGRKIYRTKAGGASYSPYLLTTITNNVDTTYQDNIADASLTGVSGESYFQTDTTNQVFLVDGVASAVLSSKATSFGYNANSGSDGVSIGHGSGKNQAGASQNVLVGSDAGSSLTTGSSNVFVGRSAGEGKTTTSSNVGIGRNALLRAGGSSNVGVGYSSGAYTSGSYNVFLGGYSGNGVAYVTSTEKSVVVGYKAGYGLTTGDNNILIGWQTGDAMTSGSDNIIIGHDTDASSATASDELNIGGIIKGSTTTGSESVNLIGDINMSNIPTGDTTATAMFVCWDTDGLLFLNEAGCRT